MKTELFKKVFIDGKEENLPNINSEGYTQFVVGIKEQNGFDVYSWFNYSINDYDDALAQREYWLYTFDWYLLPVPDNRDAIIEKQGEINKEWQEVYDFILPFIDYKKMVQDGDKLKIWHLDHLQKISDLISELASLQSATLHDLQNDDSAREERK